MFQVVMFHFPKSLKNDISTAKNNFELTNKTFDFEITLLLSVRSGGKISMLGMMDSISNRIK